MPEAQAHHEAAREVGVGRQEAIVLGSLGRLHGQVGRVREARAHYEHSTWLAETLGWRASTSPSPPGS